MYKKWLRYTTINLWFYIIGVFLLSILTIFTRNNPEFILSGHLIVLGIGFIFIVFSYLLHKKVKQCIEKEREIKTLLKVLIVLDLLPILILVLSNPNSADGMMMYKSGGGRHD
ncbi:MAG: hypothetical protein AB7E61_03130 [Acholeplasmataceae bacterium]